MKASWKAKSTFQRHDVTNLQELPCACAFSRYCIPALLKWRLLNYTTGAFLYKAYFYFWKHGKWINILIGNNWIQSWIKNIFLRASMNKQKSEEFLAPGWSWPWHAKGICWAWWAWVLVFMALQDVCRRKQSPRPPKMGSLISGLPAWRWNISKGQG